MHGDPITSSSNPRIAAAARLRDSGPRRDSGLTLVDGRREIARAVAAGIEVVELFLFVDAETHAAADWLASTGLRATLAARGTRVTPVHGPAFTRVAFGDRNEGCVAVIRFRGRSIDEVVFPGARPLLVVEGIEKPGNLGAILRTVDAAGLGGIIACGGGTDPANPATIRASLGTVFSVALACGTTADALAACTASRRRVVAAMPEGSGLWHEADLTGGPAILLGSEARGIDPAWQAAAARGLVRLDTIRLPMLGQADSLNVAATAAVLAYECQRQEDARRPRTAPEDHQA
jgi:TrmH family RNA methyltransferase